MGPTDQSQPSIVSELSFNGNVIQMAFHHDALLALLLLLIVVEGAVVEMPFLPPTLLCLWLLIEGLIVYVDNIFELSARVLEDFVNCDMALGEGRLHDPLYLRLLHPSKVAESHILIVFLSFIQDDHFLTIASGIDLVVFHILPILFGCRFLLPFIERPSRFLSPKARDTFDLNIVH